MKRIIIWTALFLPFCCTVAQTPFSAGLRMSVGALNFDQNYDNTSGPGLELELGYAFNRHLQLLASGGGFAFHQNRLNVGNVDVGPRLLLGSIGVFEPYVDARFSAVFIRPFDDMETRHGLGGMLGAGVRLPVNSQLAFSSGLTVGRLVLDKVEAQHPASSSAMPIDPVFPADNRAWNVRLNAGVSFRF